MPQQLIPIFRTPEGDTAYRECYERTMACWPEGREDIEVRTRFGYTRVNAAGSPDLPALMLIHGFGFSSAQWYPNVPALMPHFRVFAPDVPDQLGLSMLSHPLGTRENYAIWIDEMLEQLGVDQLVIGGHSYGGWLSTNFAIEQPDRIKALVLIAPAATFVPLSPEFYIRGIFGGSMSGAFHLDWPVYSMINWMTTMRPVRGMEIVEQFKVGMKNMAPLQPAFPEVFNVDEFARLTMPVLLVIGDHEVVYAQRPLRVIEEARKVLPGIEVALIANGGHAVSIDQAEATNNALCQFLLPYPLEKSGRHS